MSAEFLAQLDRQAAARSERRAALPPAPPCRMCKGSCSVGRYVLPNVVALVECSSCKGTGNAPATTPTADQGPAIQIYCPFCKASPGNACRSPKSGGFLSKPHAQREHKARELFGDGVDT